MPFTFSKLDIPEVIFVEPKVFQDERGLFSEIFKFSDFKEAGIEKTFVQVNHSVSRKGVLRGLHYQKDPKAQGKLVSVAHGEIFDVAVDIRKNSPTYGSWVGRTLTSEDRTMLYIPEGFAHGFCVLSNDAEVTYYCTDEYAPEYEAGIIWNDSTIGIEWPVQEPLLNDKDKRYPSLAKADNTFEYTS